MRNLAATSAAVLLAIPAALGAGVPRLAAADDPVALEVAVVSGVTGAPVRGARVRWPGRNLLVESHGVHRAASVPRERGTGGGVSYRLELPSGWVALPAEFNPTGEVLTRYTRTIRHVAVVWPAARARVRVIDAEGRPAAGVHVAVVRGNPEREPRYATSNSVGCSDDFLNPLDEGETDASGEAVLEGVPAVPDATFRAVASSWEFEACSPRRLLDPSGETLFVVELAGRRPLGRRGFSVG